MDCKRNQQLMALCSGQTHGSCYTSTRGLVHYMLCFVLQLPVPLLCLHELKCIVANIKLVLFNHQCAFVTGLLQARIPFYKEQPFENNLVLHVMPFMLQMEDFNCCKLEMDEQQKIEGIHKG